MRLAVLLSVMVVLGACVSSTGGTPYGNTSKTGNLGYATPVGGCNGGAECGRGR
ncbi:hypothetical protein ACS3QZ_08740 [Shimia sp. W99]